MLTKRERECLYWAARDKSIKETAELMFVSVDTVKGYRTTLIRKYACKSIAGVVFKSLAEA